MANGHGGLRAGAGRPFGAKTVRLKRYGTGRAYLLDLINDFDRPGRAAAAGRDRLAAARDARDQDAAPGGGRGGPRGQPLCPAAAAEAAKLN